MKQAFPLSRQTCRFFDIWTRRCPEIASLPMLLEHFQGGSLKHYPCQFNDALRLHAAAFWAQSVRSDAIFDKRVSKVLYCLHFRPFRASRAQPPGRPGWPLLGPPNPPQGAPKHHIHMFRRPVTPRGAPRPHIHAFRRREARQTSAPVVSGAPWKMVKCAGHCKN